MRESKSKAIDKSDIQTAKNYNRTNMNRKKVSVNKKATYDGVTAEIDTDSVDMPSSSRTCDSPVKSEYSEEGSGTDLSASSSITGGRSSQSSRSRSNQSPSTIKKSEVLGIKFQPGIRLEAKDLGNGTWYPVKVVEVDWEEEEILIHFEKWSQRYDEWVPMDSSRLRPVMEPPGGSFVKKVTKIFKAGDKVMATWSDSRKYPATVKTVLGNDRYEVLFFDGFSKNIKGGRMIPLKDEELAKIQKLQPGIGPSNDHTNPVPVISESSEKVNSPMAEALGTKEERRERKRKLNVAELFHFKKRARLDSPSAHSSTDSSKKPQRGGKWGSGGGRKKGPWPHEASSLVQVKVGPPSPAVAEETLMEKNEETVSQPVADRGRGNTSKRRRRPKIIDDGENTTKRSKSDEERRNVKKIGQKFTKFRERGKRTNFLSARKDKNVEDSDTQRGKKRDGDGETGKTSKVADDWEPVGEPAYIIDGTDGPRKSIIVADARIPPGWTRHTIQRMSGHSAGKWDVFFVCPEGRKFRTRHELRLYYEDRGEIFPTEQFDFSLGRRKSKISEANNVDSTSSVTAATSGMKIMRQTAPGSSPHLNLALCGGETSNETPVRRVKTLLPRVRPPNMEAMSPTSHVSPGSDCLDGHSTISDGSVVLGGLKIQKENDAFRCPKEGCNKNFRKENLLQMHMKHYHPEYNRFVASTPNVADLAYARTVGERLEELHPRTPRSSILEKISRFEAMRRARANPPETGPSSPSVSIQSSSAIPPSEYPIVSLTPLTSIPPRTSPPSSHPSEAPSAPDNSVLSPGSPAGMDRAETPQSSVRTLLPVVRLASADLPAQGALSDALSTSTAPSDPNSQSTEVPSAVEVKTEERGSDSPVAGVSQTKSLRTVRRRHMSDFHMEPLLKKRKSEDSPQNAVVNGNITRQTRTESLRREELINCTCGYPEEDGLMIQCDLCMCWQHGLCNNIEHEDHVPEKYVCYICQNPPRERQSKHFLHDQDWLKEGRLPSLSFRSKNALRIAEGKDIFKRSHDLTGSLLELEDVIHSLRVKVNIAEKKDHPKLYLWAHSWEKTASSSPNQTVTDVHGSHRDDQSLSQNQLEDSKEISKQREVNVDSTQSQSDFSLSTYNSPLCEVAEKAHNVGGEANEVSLQSETADLLTDECDTKDTCFSQETSGSAKEIGEEKAKQTALDVTETVVLDNSIDIGTETEVATAEVEIDQEGDGTSVVKEETPDEGKNSESSVKEESTMNSEDKKPNCIKMETDDEEDELQLPLCQNNLVDVASSTGNPINPVDIKIEPSKKLVQCAPQPEAPIDSAECRLILLDHIDHLQHQVETRLASIESQVEELENMDLSSEPSSDARTKETIQMLLRDLTALYDIAAFN